MKNWTSSTTAAWALFGLFWLFMLLLAWLEQRRPAMLSPPGSARRVTTNLSFGALAFLMPLTAPLLALWAQRQGFGLFNTIGLIGAAAFVPSLFVRSLLAYWAHRLSHRIPLLWRLHRVHHSDLALDLSTSFRTHPADMVLLTGWIAIFVLLLGLSPEALLAYEIAFPFVVAWHHANIRTGERLERWASLLLVTPGFHQVHHSCEQLQTDSNYSELFSLWDWVFGTASPLPGPARQAMRIGLGDAYDAKSESLSAQLLLPLRAPARPAEPLAPG